MLDQLLPALATAKAEFGPIIKNVENDFLKSKYANLNGILGAVEPALTSNGLMFVHFTHYENGKNVLVTRLYHVDSGQYVHSEWALNPQQQTPQGEGSALTYGRRYAITAMLGLIAEDDDGHAASQRQPAVDWPASLAKTKTVADVEELGRQAATVGAFDKYRELFLHRRTELAFVATPVEDRTAPMDAGQA